MTRHVAAPFLPVLVVIVGLFVVPKCAIAQTEPLVGPTAGVARLMLDVQAPAIDRAPAVASRLDRGPRAPSALTALQISFGGLQALDVATTIRAMRQGGTEANPFMRGAAGNSLAFVSVKAGAAVSTILLSSKVARKNPVAAIALMAAVNTGYAVIVARNLRAAPGR